MRGRRGHPVTTSSSTTARIQFRIGAADRERARTLALSRGIGTADLLAKAVLLRELDRETKRRDKE